MVGKSRRFVYRGPHHQVYYAKVWNVRGLFHRHLFLCHWEHARIGSQQHSNDWEVTTPSHLRILISQFVCTSRTAIWTYESFDPTEAQLAAPQSQQGRACRIATKSGQAVCYLFIFWYVEHPLVIKVVIHCSTISYDDIKKLPRTCLHVCSTTWVQAATLRFWLSVVAGS